MGTGCGEDKGQINDVFFKLGSKLFAEQVDGRVTNGEGEL